MDACVRTALGVLFGGWRIVHSMGSPLAWPRPVKGFAAERAGAYTNRLATGFSQWVCTTHTIIGVIVGVDATNRLSGARWGLARHIVWA